MISRISNGALWQLCSLLLLAIVMLQGSISPYVRRKSQDVIDEDFSVERDHFGDDGAAHSDFYNVISSLGRPRSRVSVSDLSSCFVGRINLTFSTRESI